MATKAKPCKYCDRPVAPNAKTCPACGGKRPYPIGAARSFVSGVLALGLLGFCLWGAFFSGSGSPQTGANAGASRGASRSASLGAGSKATFERATYVGRDRATYDRLVKLATADDTDGMTLMALSGEALIVPAGTRCRVIGVESAFFGLLEVRILDGDHAMRSCVVDGSFLRAE